MRVVIATSPVKAPRDTVVLDVAHKFIVRDGKMLIFNSKEVRCVSFTVLSTMLIRFAAGKFLSLGELCDITYCEDENGGPIDPRMRVWQTAQRYRDRLEEIGLRLRVPHRNHGMEVVDLWV